MSFLYFRVLLLNENLFSSKCFYTALAYKNILLLEMGLMDSSWNSTLIQIQSRIPWIAEFNYFCEKNAVKKLNYLKFIENLKIPQRSIFNFYLEYIINNFYTVCSSEYMIYILICYHKECSLTPFLACREKYRETTIRMDPVPSCRFLTG